MPLGASVDLLWIGVARAFDLIKGSLDLDLDLGGVDISAEVLDGVGFFCKIKFSSVVSLIKPINGFTIAKLKTKAQLFSKNNNVFCLN